MIVLLLSLIFSANQGSAVQMTFRDEPELKSIEIDWENKKVPAFHVQDRWITILGVDLDAKPGKHVTPVFFTLNDGRIEKREAVIEVNRRNIPRPSSRSMTNT